MKAKGNAYGPKVVAQYLKDGTIDTSKGESYEEQMDKFFASIRNEDGSNLIRFTDESSTVDKICAYLESELDKKSDSYEFAVRYPSKYTATVTGNYKKLVKINDRMEEEINTRINTKYADVLRRPINVTLYLEMDAEANYFAHRKGNFYYQEGKGRMIEYTVHFVDADGNPVGSQTGVSEKRRSIKLTFPEGYSYISSDDTNCQVKKGKVSYGGRSFQILSNEEVEVTIRLRSLNPDKASPSNASGK